MLSKKNRKFNRIVSSNSQRKREGKKERKRERERERR